MQFLVSRKLFLVENGLSYDTLNFGVFSMIIYIGKIIWQISYAVSRFVDLIEILKFTACQKN